MNIINVFSKLKVILPTVRKLATGLGVVSQALWAAIEELERVKPDFRYLEHLKVALEYMKKGVAILEKVLEVLGESGYANALTMADVTDIERFRKELSKV